MGETIRSNEGFVLTNGEVYGTIILLADGASKEDFYEIPLAEYEALIERDEDEISEADYREALREFGVVV